MTSEVTEGQIPDVYGQVHPIESDELLVAKLRDLEEELGLIATEDKTHWMQAMAKCPELVADDSKLKFLRCEVFNADVSTLVHHCSSCKPNSDMCIADLTNCLLCCMVQLL